MHNMALEFVSLNHSYLISSNYILQSELIECGMPTENPPSSNYICCDWTYLDSSAHLR